MVHKIVYMEKIDENGKIYVEEIPIISFVGLM